MTEKNQRGLADYYAEAASWSADKERSRLASQRWGWIVAGIAMMVALLEAIALMALAPLKTVVPYTLLVDRQTGYVQALKPTEQTVVTPDAALTRSFLAQYVIARESFDVDVLNDNYRRTALWSAGEARSAYLSAMQATNPASPLMVLPRRTVVATEVRSISSLGKDVALVRFATFRTDPGRRSSEPLLWVAVVKFRFSNASMSADDRLLNPLGFQVLSYRRDPETILFPQQANSAAAPAGSVVQVPSPATAVQPVPAAPTYPTPMRQQP